MSWVILRRDSGPFETSNFEAALTVLEKEDSDNYERHSFGHWACGHYDILIVRPDTWAHAATIAIAQLMESYPLLDEDDYFEREYTAACETWVNMSLRERIQVCALYRVSIFAARRGVIPEDGNGSLFDCLRPEN